MFVANESSPAVTASYNRDGNISNNCALSSFSAFGMAPGHDSPIEANVNMHPAGYISFPVRPSAAASSSFSTPSRDVGPSVRRRAVAIQADSADAAAVQTSVETTVAELGGLDILVNNVGILRLSTVKDISLEDINALLDINVRAPIVASKAAIPHLGKGGRIINIGSFFADKVPGGAGLPVYVLTKSALTAFSQGLARELGPRDITVNVLQPGSIDTDMNPAHGPFGEILRSITTLGRYETVEDIANIVAFLASSKAQYITGAALTVDGGANG